MEYLKPNEKRLMKECAGANLSFVGAALSGANGNANILDEDRTSLLHVVRPSVPTNRRHAGMGRARS